MLGADALAWLVKLLAGEAIKSRLGGKGVRAELRMLRKALQESQQHREELAEVERIALELERQRDAYFAEVVRLRAENVALRVEVARLGRGER